MTDGGAGPLGDDESALPARVWQDAFAHAAVPAVVVDLYGRYRAVNAAFAELVGRPAEGLIGSDFTTVTHPEDAALIQQILERARRDGVPSSGRMEQRFVRPGGAEVRVALHAVPMTEVSGETLLLAQMIDLTEQRRAESELAHRATHDALTELSTRGVFLDQLGRALARLPRTSGRHAVVLFLDLDRLKYVNDTYGHLSGDAVIIEFATRLRAALRPSDVIARLGGDEFAVLLEDVVHPAESVAVAERILDGLEAPFHFASRRIEIRASIGVAVSTTDRTTPEALVAHADAAMYRAKQRGSGRFELFDEDAYTAGVRRQEIEDRLRAGVRDGELLLHYQPIVDVQTLRLVGVEALLRWQHPERGLVVAAEFIDIAERSDLLRPLAGWLFETALCQLARWDRELGAAAPQQMYVNVAGSQFGDDRLLSSIKDAVARSGVDVGRLSLEITETQILADPKATAATLDELLELGCTLVVDDFGTGYSSLSRLADLPVGVLKIDRSFTRDLTSNRRTSAVAASIALLAHNLGQVVIAEGVETAEQLLAVSELGYEYAQGYYLSPALAPDQLAGFISG